MSEHILRNRRQPIAGRIALFLVPAVLAALGVAAHAGGPMDLPFSNEPRVEAGKSLTSPGLLGSEGNQQPFFRIPKGDAVYTRDLLVALPGFKIDIEPTNKNVMLTLWGNLPELSHSPVLESAVILHDTGAFDLDLTLLRGRIVLTNTRAKGAARVWLRAQAGVKLVLPEPGDSVAIEIYGRWLTGEPFSAKAKAGTGPIQIWEVHCLKGTLDIKAARTEWFMSAPPGPAYFTGDSLQGPSRTGPEKRTALPTWADPKVAPPLLAKVIKSVVADYANRLKDKELPAIGQEILALAAKEKNPAKARAMRQIIIAAMAAADQPDKVVELLAQSKIPEIRDMAVIALRHWIGAGDTRDQKLYEELQNELGYKRSEAETIMQLLHSPFDRSQPETYETLIAYLRHRKQAIRELAHWHLIRLAPGGRDIPYDASASVAERDKAAAAWKKLIPSGELPPVKKDETKK